MALFLAGVAVASCSPFFGGVDGDDLNSLPLRNSIPVLLSKETGGHRQERYPDDAKIYREDLIDAYVKMGFDTDGLDFGYHVKWGKDTVNVRVSEFFEGNHRNLIFAKKIIAETLTNVKKITGVNFTRDNGAEFSDIEIILFDEDSHSGAKGRLSELEVLAINEHSESEQYIFDESKLERLSFPKNFLFHSKKDKNFGQIDCKTLMQWHPIGSTKSGQMRNAIFGINVDTPLIWIQACIEEEFLHAMGSFRDNPYVRPTLLNDFNEFGLRTRLDDALLAIKYSPEMQPGILPDQAIPIIENIARSIWPESYDKSECEEDEVVWKDNFSKGDYFEYAVLGDSKFNRRLDFNKKIGNNFLWTETMRGNGGEYIGPFQYSSEGLFRANDRIYSPALPILLTESTLNRFPLQGENFKVALAENTEAEKATYQRKYSIQDYVRVNVPAGSFCAYLIEGERRYLDNDNIAKFLYYYSPEIGGHVKLVRNVGKNEVIHVLKKTGNNAAD